MNDEFELEDRFRWAIGSLSVPHGPERPAFLDASLVPQRQTPWLAVLAAAAVVLLIAGGLIGAGFTTHRPPAADPTAGVPSPTGSTHPALTFPSSDLYWRLKRTSAPAGVPQTCPVLPASVYLPIPEVYELLDVQRGPSPMLALVYDMRNYPTDVDVLKGSVVGDTFTASRSDSNPPPRADAGIPATRCGLLGAWQLEVQVVGHFSADGQRLSAREMQTYRFPTGDTLVFAWDWEADAPSVSVAPRPTPSPSPRPTIPPPTSVQFEVFVVDDDGAPLPDAVVTVGGTEWLTDRAGRASGRATIEPAWGTQIETTKAGYDPVVRKVTSVQPRELFHLHKVSRIPADLDRTATVSTNDRDDRCDQDWSGVQWLSGVVTEDDPAMNAGPPLACRVITIISTAPFRLQLDAPNRSAELGFLAVDCPRRCGPVITPGPGGETAIGVVRHTLSRYSSFDDPDPITFTIRAVVAPP